MQSSKFLFIKLLLNNAFILLSLCCFAQNYDYKQYTTKDGLPTNYVYGVIEDDNGYIWVYTEFGISKFDGYSFKNYTTKDGLPGNDIAHCIKDKDGRIWLYCYKNRISYLQNDSITIVSDEISYEPFLHNGNCSFSTTLQNSYTFNKDGLISVENKFYSDKLVDQVIGGKWHNSNYIYIQNEKGQNKLHWSQDHLKGSKIIDSNNYQTIHFHQLGASNKYLILPHSKQSISAKHLYIFDMEAVTLKKIDITELFIDGEVLKPDICDSTFQLTNSSLFKEFDFNGEITESIKVNSKLKSKNLKRFYKDSKDNLWIGSREGGLFFIPKKNKKVILLEAEANNYNSFEKIQSINNNLYCIDKNGGVYQIQNLALTKVNPDVKSQFRSSVKTPYGDLISLAQHSFIISNNKSSNLKFENFNARFTMFQKTNSNEKKLASSLIHGYINAFTTTFNKKNNTLYFNPKSHLRKFRFLDEHTMETSINLKSPIAKCLYFHPDEEKVFLASIDGLYVENNETFEPFLLSPELNNITALYGTGNKLFIGTENDGFYELDIRTKNLKQISTHIRIKNIKESNTGDIFLASGEGVVLIKANNKNEKTIKVYNSNDGLPSNEVKDIHLEGKNNLYVATSSGICKLDLAFDTNYKPEQSDLKTVSFLVNDKEVKHLDSLDFSRTENSIEIEYLLLSYPSEAKVKYNTKLEPIQTEWHETKNKNVNYLSLAPMDYKFHLKATDIYGNELKQNPIEFTIRKAFWQTTWFRVLCFMILCSSIFLFFKVKEKQTRNNILAKAQFDKRMANLELSALKAQMNPHFVFNALGAIQYFIQINDVESADNYLTRFARLMRKYLESSKEKMLPLKEEIELLTLYTQLEKLRFEDLFDVEITVSPNIQIEDTYLPTMIIQPFIENAINHGLNERRDKQGMLTIDFHMVKETLICIVTDNGIGRVNAEKLKWKNHRSRGMEIISGKIQALRSSGIIDVQINTEDLDTEDEQFPGTAVHFKFKILDNE